MGQVFRATDTKLKRQVAIKILPSSLAADHDRLARFQREAEVLASLNHPNVGAIYGLEEDRGTTALVMELVEGDDLSQRIARGAIPLDEALPIARQIADALEAAHEQGIIHRDLKPANIKIRTDGTVKVLDFGLAQTMDPAAGSSLGVSMSPTTTSPAMTQAGMILGTAAYMAPEQAKGRAVDKRADIFAFGAVLYEMLTGKRAFQGDDVTDLIVAVVSKEPDWAALSPSTPLSVRSTLRRCLEKDPKRRLRDIGEARLALDGAHDPAPPQERQKPRPMAWALAAVAVVSLAVAAWAWSSRPAADEKRSARLTISIPPGAEITSYPAISRDGRTVAYVSQLGADDAQLYLRDLNAFEARAVAGSAGAKQPFFSPDGKWVAFFSRGLLWKAEVAGGAPVRIADAAYAFGGTWNDDNTIIYSTSLGSGLFRIPAAGGNPESLTKPDGAAKGYAHVFPQALPGGKSVLLAVWGQTQGSAVLSLETGQWQIVLPMPSFSSSLFDPNGGGRLLLIDQAAASVRAAPFDPARPALTSTDATVLEDVHFDVETEIAAWLAVSNTGTAVYAPGNPARTSLVWVDQTGKIESLGREQDVYRESSISPDGTKAVVRHGLNLWIHDLRRGTRNPLTSGDAGNILPQWTRDGLRIIFASNRGGDWDIYSQPADASRPAEVLLKQPNDQFPYSVLADGTLVFTEIQAKTGRDMWMLAPGGKPSPVRVTPFNELAPQFSPGPAGGLRWVAYASDESGRSEVYVQSHPGGENRIPVSTGGGILPMWSPDGRQIFYLSPDAVMAVTMEPDGAVGAPRRLFDRSPFLMNDRFHSYSVSADGKRFLMIQRDAGSVPRQLNVILNWQGELKPVVTTK